VNAELHVFGNAHFKSWWEAGNQSNPVRQISNLVNFIFIFLLSLLPHTVSVSCQIKKMVQPVHTKELLASKSKNTLDVWYIMGICFKFYIQISTSPFQTWHLLGI